MLKIMPSKKGSKPAKKASNSLFHDKMAALDEEESPVKGQTPTKVEIPEKAYDETASKTIEVIKAPCTLCDGSGKRTVVVEHKYTKLKKLAVEWCPCLKSTLVSSERSLKLLQGLGANYIHFEDVDPKLLFTWPPSPDEKANHLTKNWFITGTLSTFQYHIKGVVMHYKYMDPAPLIYACNAIDVLKDFYVEQTDGSKPSLTNLNKYDLVVIALGTVEKNDVLKTCLAQVVHNRVSAKKMTWIYNATPSLEKCLQDYSPELKESIIGHFTHIKLRSVEGVALKASSTNIGASNYTPAKVEE
jgi:hypothetical protein